MPHRWIIACFAAIAIVSVPLLCRGAGAPTQPAGDKKVHKAMPTKGQPGSGTAVERGPAARSGPATRPSGTQPAGGAGGPGAGGEGEGEGGLCGGMNIMVFYGILLGGFVLLYVWMGRSRRKQESKRKEMIANLKKGDKIVSIGGIVGTVIEARTDEITVKVDETNNVRMKFARWAIRGVGEDAKSETPEKK